MPAEPTATSAATRPDPARGFDEDTRALLWWRLLILHLAAAVLAVVAGGLIAGWHRPPSLGPQPGWLGLVPLLQTVECVGGAVFLWRRPHVSLGGLRALEFAHFAAAIGGSAVTRFARLAAVPAAELPDPALAVSSIATSTTLPFMTIVAVYGTVIPNAPRRSLLVVGGMIGLFYLATFAAAAANPPIAAYLPSVLASGTVSLLMPGLAAVFVASRNHALRRRAFEAERRADELGQYRLQKKLGEGGMGEVWLAEHRLLKRPCAVKFVRADLAANPANAARVAPAEEADPTATLPRSEAHA